MELAYAKKGLMWALVSGIGWGLGGVLLGLAMAMAPFTAGATIYTGPLVASAMNDGFGGIYLFIYNVYTGRWKDVFRTLKTWPGMLVCIAAVFGGPIAMGGYLMGIELAGPAYAMGISALYPVVGAFLAVIVLKEKITPRVWFGIIFSVIGAIVMSYVPPSGSHPHFYLGLGLALLAALGWGIEGVLSTYGMEMVDPSVAINLRQATSSVVSLVAVLPLIGGLMLFGKALLTFNSLWIVAAAALVGAISYWSWYKAFSMCGVGRTMALNITYSIWGIVFTYFFTKTEITTNLVVGAIIITLGSILVVSNPSEIVKLRKVEE
jgi:drug/metabolite transporter (DMT)-like permease